ncbi:unnamed protein product [Enterobius vermicularis]|uniref:Response regulator n=1 Tax=Enterobius vermicularis TaxID=51028 RepID=A0A0N4VQL9_ENTVE|nr:unnamed protein product [Enterobius vermicularis]
MNSRKRFIARRRVSKVILYDNATTFKGLHRLLEEL